MQASFFSMRAVSPTGWYVRNSFLASLLLLLLCASGVFGYTVRPDHPRIYLTPDNLPEIKSRIQTQHAQIFQNKVINWADDHYNDDLTGKVNTDQLGRHILNYAFLYQVGQIPGFSYRHTTAEYGAKAKETWQQLLNASANTTKVFEKRMEHYGAIGYDWLYDLLSQQEKEFAVSILLDGIEVIERGTFPGWNIPLKTKIDLVSALAFYGDGINDAEAQRVLDQDWQTEIFNASTGSFGFANAFAGDDGGWTEWFQYSIRCFHFMKFLMDAWYTATGEDIYRDSAYFQNYAKWYASAILPYAEANASLAGGREWKILRAFQGNAGLKASDPSVLEMPNMLLTSYRDSRPDVAGLNAWLAKYRMGENLVDEAVVYQILWQDKAVTPKSPQELNLPLTQKYDGLGWVVMRTGWESLDDTMVTFTSASVARASHWSGGEQNSFTIDKWGPLTMHAGAKVHQEYQLRSWAYNTMVFPDPSMNYDYSNSDWAGQQFRPGLLPYDLGGIERFEAIDSEYTYILGDATANYTSPANNNANPPKIDLFTRQFVYLKPDTNLNSDYIVVFDRTRTLETRFEKRWLLHMGFDPQINGTGTQINPATTEYTNADLVTISNTGFGSQHGKLFSKTLLPEQHKIRKVGGPNNEFYIDVYGGNWTKMAQVKFPLSDADANYAGRYRIEVVSTTGELYDTFLHVLQTADAYATNQMVATVRVDGDTMVGAHIAPSPGQREWVVMFSRTEDIQTQATYSITAYSGTTEHLITDLDSGVVYYVSQDGTKIAETAASDAGTIRFSAPGGGNFSITQTGAEPLGKPGKPTSQGN